MSQCLPSLISVKIQGFISAPRASMHVSTRVGPPPSLPYTHTSASPAAPLPWYDVISFVVASSYAIPSEAGGECGKSVTKLSTGSIRIFFGR